MAVVFIFVFGVIAFFGIRMLRSGWAVRKNDQVGATVKLLFGYAFSVLGVIGFLISTAIALLS